MRLYRAVSQTELEDIRSTGAFRDSIHGSGEKAFYYEIGDAARMAKSFEKMVRQIHSVVSADAPEDVVARGRRHEAAQEGAGVYLLVDDLPLLGPALEEEL